MWNLPVISKSAAISSICFRFIFQSWYDGNLILKRLSIVGPRARRIAMPFQQPRQPSW
jgi:hypothetical protein